jgi:hypothetical protein
VEFEIVQQICVRDSNTKFGQNQSSGFGGYEMTLHKNIFGMSISKLFGLTEKKSIVHKMCVLFISTTLVQNVLCSDKYLASYRQKCILVLMQSVSSIIWDITPCSPLKGN